MGILLMKTHIALLIATVVMNHVLVPKCKMHGTDTLRIHTPDTDWS